MGMSRQQAADKLGVSVHTIKSYELNKRSVPAPMAQLMDKMELEKNGDLGVVPGAPIRIVGGGTISHVRNRLALCAPAYGSTAKALLALCQAHDKSADLTLTRMADPLSTIETSADLEMWARRTVSDLNAKIIFWNPAVVDFEGAVGDIPSGEKSQRLDISETINCQLTPANKIVAMFRQQRKDIFLVAFKTTTNATPDEQHAAGVALIKEACANLVLANDAITGVNMVVTPEEGRYHETKDREVALAGLVEMALRESQMVPASSEGHVVS